MKKTSQKRRMKEELSDVLTAISVVAKMLAQRARDTGSGPPVDAKGKAFRHAYCRR